MQKLEEKAVKIAEWMGSVSSLILHTLIFATCFALIIIGFDFEKVMLTLTTIVSLEAIYLAIFIQMSVNRNTRALNAVEKDVHEIQEDVEEITEDVSEIQEDVENIEKDIDEIQEDVEDIEKDIDEIQEDVEEISEDVESIEKEIDEIHDDVEDINTENNKK